MAKVYLTKEDSHLDFSPALQYGEIEVLVSRDCPLHADTTGFVEAVRKRLVDITPEDYLLLSGDPVTIGIALTIAACNLNGTLNLLKYVKSRRTYLPVRVHIPMVSSHIKGER